MLKAAIWYARRGMWIIPLHTAIDGSCSCGEPLCGSIGKHPRTQHGLDDATTDEAIVRELWARWPDANVGIVTGPSDLVVIDVDPKNGGDESFAFLRSEIGPEAFETVTTLTGGGGEHYYFRVGEKRFRNSAGKVLGDGIDVRADGGYVVAPPSTHASGGVYAWEIGFGLHEREIAPLPDALERKLSQKKTQLTGDAIGVEIIPQGRRHETLVSFAGLMRRHGSTADEIESALLVMNEKRCRPQCDLSHMGRIARSVEKYAPSVGLYELVRSVLPTITGETGGTPQDQPPEQAGFAVLRSWTQAFDMRRYSTGLADLDSVTQSLRPGELSLVGAWTGVGKSGFSEQIALEISRNARTLFFPLELGVARTERRMLAKIMQNSESTIERLERSNLQSDKHALYEAVETLQSRRLSMWAPGTGNALFFADLVRMIKAHRPDVVFIDHMQHLEDWTPSARARSDLNAASIFRELRKLAELEKIHIVCIHQLKGDRLKKGQRPQIYDFADSAALPRIADTVLCLNRPFKGMAGKDKIMEILVLKNRRGPEPWIHTHFEGSHIAMYPMTRIEAAMAECCAVRTPGRSA